jgi:hypothetical protein
MERSETNMARFDENQRDVVGNQYDKTNYTYRNGNVNVRYQKDANGRIISVARPAFIKIK